MIHNHYNFLESDWLKLLIFALFILQTCKSTNNIMITFSIATVTHKLFFVKMEDFFTLMGTTI